jgi:uncharacterized membrane protein YgdD (TMEM256/DUF423 family)
MHKTFLIIGTIVLGVAVILGAFGAHGLRRFVPADSIGTFETGVRYQFYHGFALMITAILYERYRNKKAVYAGYLFLAGIVLFSGSLYLLTFLKATNSVGLSGIGIVTPVGGLLFIAGWITLLIAVTRGNRSSLKSI